MGRFCIITYTPVGYHLKEVNKECKCGYNIPFSKDIATSKVGFSPRDWKSLYLHTTIHLKVFI